jgi:hypothetical protein
MINAAKLKANKLSDEEVPLFGSGIGRHWTRRPFVLGDGSEQG